MAQTVSSKKKKANLQLEGYVSASEFYLPTLTTGGDYYVSWDQTTKKLHLTGSGGGGGGDSGYSGYSGKSGYSGQDGSQGVSGTSGYSGTDGASGVNALGHHGLQVGEGLIERLPPADLDADSAVATIGADAGGYQIAQSAETGKGLRPRS